MKKIVHSIVGGALLLGILILSGCSKINRCHIPIGDVNCTIDLTMPSYYPLLHPGGYVKVIGGHKGVYIFCNAINEYVAYEAACPLDNEVSVVPSKEYEGVLECPKCKSRFINGEPAIGSATPCFLRQYTVHKDGYTLYVSN